MQDLDDSGNKKDAGKKPKGVLISTIHAAKGLGGWCDGLGPVRHAAHLAAAVGVKLGSLADCPWVWHVGCSVACSVTASSCCCQVG